jgi:hypothetical protein
MMETEYFSLPCTVLEHPLSDASLEGSPMFWELGILMDCQHFPNLVVAVVLIRVIALYPQ